LTPGRFGVGFTGLDGVVVGGEVTAGVAWPAAAIDATKIRKARNSDVRSVCGSKRP